MPESSRSEMSKVKEDHPRESSKFQDGVRAAGQSRHSDRHRSQNRLDRQSSGNDRNLDHIPRRPVNNSSTGRRHPNHDHPPPPRAFIRNSLTQPSITVSGARAHADDFIQLWDAHTESGKISAKIPLPVELANGHAHIASEIPLPESDSRESSIGVIVDEATNISEPVDMDIDEPERSPKKAAVLPAQSSNQSKAPALIQFKIKSINQLKPQPLSQLEGDSAELVPKKEELSGPKKEELTVLKVEDLVEPKKADLIVPRKEKSISPRKEAKIRDDSNLMRDIKLSPTEEPIIVEKESRFGKKLKVELEIEIPPEEPPTISPVRQKVSFSLGFGKKAAGMGGSSTTGGIAPDLDGETEKGLPKIGLPVVERDLRKEFSQVTEKQSKISEDVFRVELSEPVPVETVSLPLIKSEPEEAASVSQDKEKEVEKEKPFSRPVSRISTRNSPRRPPSRRSRSRSRSKRLPHSPHRSPSDQHAHSPSRISRFHHSPRAAPTPTKAPPSPPERTFRSKITQIIHGGQLDQPGKNLDEVPPKGENGEKKIPSAERTGEGVVGSELIASVKPLIQEGETEKGEEERGKELGRKRSRSPKVSRDREDRRGREKSPSHRRKSSPERAAKRRRSRSARRSSDRTRSPAVNCDRESHVNSTEKPSSAGDEQRRPSASPVPARERKASPRRRSHHRDNSPRRSKKLSPERRRRRSRSRSRSRDRKVLDRFLEGRRRSDDWRRASQEGEDGPPGGRRNSRLEESDDVRVSGSPLRTDEKRATRRISRFSANPALQKPHLGQIPLPPGAAPSGPNQPLPPPPTVTTPAPPPLPLDPDFPPVKSPIIGTFPVPFNFAGIGPIFCWPYYLPDGTIVLVPYLGLQKPPDEFSIEHLVIQPRWVDPLPLLLSGCPPGYTPLNLNNIPTYDPTRAIPPPPPSATAPLNQPTKVAVQKLIRIQHKERERLKRLRAEKEKAGKEGGFDTPTPTSESLSSKTTTPQELLGKGMTVMRVRESEGVKQEDPRVTDLTNLVV